MSNNMHSIPSVSGSETRSTQSNASPRGSSANSFPVRSRTSFSSLTIWLGLKAGAMTLRCAVWIGGSCAMKLGKPSPFTASAMVMLPMSQRELKTSWRSSTSCTRSCVTTDQ
jgi:hypothetical protein